MTFKAAAYEQPRSNNAYSISFSAGFSYVYKSSHLLSKPCIHLTRDELPEPSSGLSAHVLLG